MTNIEEGIISRDQAIKLLAKYDLNPWTIRNNSTFYKTLGVHKSYDLKDVNKWLDAIQLPKPWELTDTWYVNK